MQCPKDAYGFIQLDPFAGSYMGMDNSVYFHFHSNMRLDLKTQLHYLFAKPKSFYYIVFLPRLYIF